MNTRIDIMDLPPAPARPTEDDGLGCLRTEQGNLPLDTIDVQAAITGLASSIRLTQGFHNPHDQPLEATYVFPLPPRAAVTALRMEADGRVVDGLLKERAEARADYDQAVSEGKRASIAEEERPGVFTMRVGNIMPGERVSVHLTLAGALSYEDGAATFRFPLVVAPRFIPGEPLAGGQVGDGVAPDTDAVPDASRISPPVLLPGFPNPVRLSVAVDVDPAGLPLAGLATSLHATATTEDSPTGLRVRLAPGERADRDFLLRLRFADETAVRTSLAVRPDDPDDTTRGGTFALTVLPPTPPEKPRARDVVLVLDRSGSMGGWKMVAARRAAARIVDTLGSADRFAVLAFDHIVSSPPSLPDGLTEADDRNRFRAVEFLSAMDARGGTQMLEPLNRAATLLAAAPDRDRVLVLVTDGQVGNEDQLLRELSAPLAGVRIHTVGIDRAVNEAFLQRLAGSHGRYELVESEQHLDEAMKHIHRRIGSPVVTGLTVSSSEASTSTRTPIRTETSPETTTATGAPPKTTAATRSRSETTAATRTSSETTASTRASEPRTSSEDRASSGPGASFGASSGAEAPPEASPEASSEASSEASPGLSVEEDSLAPSPLPDLFEGAPVVVTGRYTGPPIGSVTVAGDGGWHTTVTASLSDNPSLAALWARAKVRDLEDRYVVGTGDQPGLEKRIVETSLKYSVLSRFTAFVAIDQRVVNESGEVHRVTQPVDLPSGWDPPAPAPGGHGGVYAAAAPMSRNMQFAATSSTTPASAADSASPSMSVPPARTRRPQPRRTPPAPPHTSTERPESAPPAPQPPVVPPPPLPTLIDFAATELRNLQAEAHKDVWTRTALLRALADRIRSLLDHWRHTGEPDNARDSLRHLADKLATPTDNPNLADSRWFLAIATLETVTQPKPPPRSTFWKR